MVAVQSPLSELHGSVLPPATDSVAASDNKATSAAVTVVPASRLPGVLLLLLLLVAHSRASGDSYRCSCTGTTAPTHWLVTVAPESSVLVQVPTKGSLKDTRTLVEAAAVDATKLSCVLPLLLGAMLVPTASSWVAKLRPTRDAAVTYSPELPADVGPVAGSVVWASSPPTPWTVLTRSATAWQDGRAACSSRRRP
jgi:hypothetical protein